MGEEERRRDVGRDASGSVVVDIGGDFGALVVHTEAGLETREIEICPVDSRARTHNVVRARHLPGGGVVYAGVFPSLPSGEYTVLASGCRPEVLVRVDGGAVTQINW